MQFKKNYPMSKLTTLLIGGPAKLFVAVKSEDELIEAIKYAKQNDLNHLIIGSGSNLLVNDSGVDCLVIKNEIAGTDLKGSTLKVRAGTVLQDLVDYTIEHGLAGLHKMTGIPGTIGGAVFGNAGAYGQTISDHIITVSVLNTNNLTIEQFNNSDCEFNYRDSGFKRNHYIILEVTFQLDSGDPQTLRQEVAEVLSKRLVKYPKGIKCPGSFFKNIVADTLPKDILEKIPKDKITYGKISAGYLLESVGAQGHLLDGIEIAPYHANLFINKGGGTAQAFYTLAKQMSEKVKQKFGITLEPEVQLINLPPL